MKIGVLGTGDVGKRLGSGFVSIGHDVKLGSRDPNNEKVKSWIAANGKHASGETFAEAAEFGEVIAVATLGVATQNVLKVGQPEKLRRQGCHRCHESAGFHE